MGDAGHGWQTEPEPRLWNYRVAPLTLDPICSVLWARFHQSGPKNASANWIFVVECALKEGWGGGGGDPYRCDDFKSQKSTLSTVLEEKHSAFFAHPCWRNAIWMPGCCFLEMSNLASMLRRGERWCLERFHRRRLFVCASVDGCRLTCWHPINRRCV